MKLTLRRSIGAGAKSFEVADKTSTGTIARAFLAGWSDSSEILKLFRIDRHPSREVTSRVFLALAVDYVSANQWAATCNSRTFSVATRPACRAHASYKEFSCIPKSLFHFCGKKKIEIFILHASFTNEKKEVEKRDIWHWIHRYPSFDYLDFQNDILVLKTPRKALRT